MMKWVILLLFCAGCASLSTDIMRIEPGMTRESVVRFLGSPERVETWLGQDVLVYQDREYNRYAIVFDMHDTVDVSGSYSYCEQKIRDRYVSSTETFLTTPSEDQCSSKWKKGSVGLKTCIEQIEAKKKIAASELERFFRNAEAVDRSREAARQALIQGLVSGMISRPTYQPIQPITQQPIIPAPINPIKEPINTNCSYQIIGNSVQSTCTQY